MLASVFGSGWRKSANRLEPNLKGNTRICAAGAPSKFLRNSNVRRKQQKRATEVHAKVPTKGDDAP
jgi:hypothetical protein